MDDGDVDAHDGGDRNGGFDGSIHGWGSGCIRRPRSCRKTVRMRIWIWFGDDDYADYTAELTVDEKDGDR